MSLMLLHYFPGTNKQQSTTTTAVPPVVETVVVSGSLQMNELVFVDDYNDPTSDAYQILATEVCEQVRCV